MPELPEVETTRRGIEPCVVGQQVQAVVIRQPRLRWPVPANLGATLTGHVFESVRRRGKYLLLSIRGGTVLMHLGMSGSLRRVEAASTPGKHDHVDIVLSHGFALRYHDPRRFGAILWTDEAPEQHPLLIHLGPEPLEADFSGDELFRRSRGKYQAVKVFIMNSRVVVGVGNIYASEALFRAGIHPQRAAGQVSLQRYQVLVEHIRGVLSEAIQRGGTTLRDFVNESGKPGYFQQTLNVYGRTGEPCVRCATPIRSSRIGQRSSFYCHQCQR